jgi:hypothetical protein
VPDLNRWAKMSRSKYNWPLWPPLIANGLAIAMGIPGFQGCRCWLGTWTIWSGRAWIFILIAINIRYIVGKIRKEEGIGWIVYTVFILLSPVIVSLIWGYIASLVIPEFANHE